MNLISKFLHTRLKVKEMERSLRFYIQVLGLKKVRSTVSPRGAKLVYLKVPEGEEELELTCFMNETGFNVPEMSEKLKKLVMN